MADKTHALVLQVSETEHNKLLMLTATETLKRKQRVTMSALVREALKAYIAKLTKEKNNG